MRRLRPTPIAATLTFAVVLARPAALAMASTLALLSPVQAVMLDRLSQPGAKAFASSAAVADEPAETASWRALTKTERTAACQRMLLHVSDTYAMVVANPTTSAPIRRYFDARGHRAAAASIALEQAGMGPEKLSATGQARVTAAVSGAPASRRYVVRQCEDLAMQLEALGYLKTAEEVAAFREKTLGVFGLQVLQAQQARYAPTNLK